MKEERVIDFNEEKFINEIWDNTLKECIRALERITFDIDKYYITIKEHNKIIKELKENKKWVIIVFIK